MDKSTENELIEKLMKDVTGKDISDQPKTKITETISNILHQYNLSTDLSFIEKMANLKMPKDQDGKFDISELPTELTDAAFLPVNTVADIALRNDLDLVISQIPEWFTALQITRDAICEADVVDGTLSRDIKFDSSIMMNDSDNENIMSKIEAVEERLELHSIIKNHAVFNTLEYGEGYIYAIPYAKVFNDLYKYRLSNGTNNDRNSAINMSTTSSILQGYGYGESAIERSLNDTIIAEQAVVENNPKGKRHKQPQPERHSIFTESEICEFDPFYGSGVWNEDNTKNEKATKEYQESVDGIIEHIAKNIRYIEKDVALPVIEESAYDLRAVYESKYKQHTNFVQEANNIFNRVMQEGMSVIQEANTTDSDNNGIYDQFETIKGVYIRILPATKLIPIRVDRNVIGYYYISDMTRPEEAGERKNSGLTGYTLRSPSVGYDTFAPDRMFCEKLASKIINNFDIKFMKDNIALHQQIVSILESHKFNDAMMRFIFIPAENVIQCTINKDGIGKGHSMLEPGLVTARMYMFLKLYSILYQINNSTIRVYNLRMSGLDKDYQKMVNDTMRKFAARRVTVNDIFNYRSSMTKVSGYSEMVMPMGAGDQPPITFDTIPAAEAPINNELLEKLKNESINSTPVPSLMVQTGGESQIEFAKETELANTRFNTMISGFKLDFNRDITRLYRRILRWETDIDPEIIRSLKFILRMPTAKTLNVTNEMLANYNSLVETLAPIFLDPSEMTDNDKPTAIFREFKKKLLQDYIPQISIEHIEDIVEQAKFEANKLKLEETGKGENIVDSGLEDNSDMM